MTTQELNYIYQEWLNIYSFPQEVNRVQFLALAKSGGNPYELDDRQIKFVEFLNSLVVEAELAASLLM